MARNLVQTTFEFPDWADRFRSQLKQIYLGIAATMQTNRGMLFHHEGAYNGHQKWAPLKFRSGMILSKRGTLRKSIAPKTSKGMPGENGIVRISHEKVTIGTRLFYARLMNDGTTKMPDGKLHAKHAKALRIPLPQGKTATPAAKDLGKTAHRGKNYLQRIKELEHSIDTTKNPHRRAKMRQQLAKMKQSSKGMKESDKYIFRKSVKIPARNFDDLTVQDDREIADATAELIKRVLDGDNARVR